MNILESVGSLELYHYNLYGLYVIPESRLFEFIKPYKIQNPSSFITNTLNNASYNSAHSDIPHLVAVDRCINELHQLYSSSNYLSYENHKLLGTHNMVLIDNKAIKSILYDDYADVARHIKYPFFSSIERAKEFLIMSSLTFGTPYVTEHRDLLTLSWLPAEVAVMEMTNTEVFDLSVQGVVAVNPYVPAFF